MRLAHPKPAMFVGTVIMLIGAVAGVHASSHVVFATAAGPQTTVFSCNDPAQCIAIRNNGRGSGVLGISTYSNRKKSPIVADRRAGLYGLDLSNDPYNANSGVYGLSKTGFGVTGVTRANLGHNLQAVGVLALDASPTINRNSAFLAISQKNEGIESFTYGNRTAADSSANGVSAADLSTTESNNDGVAAISNVNNALFAGSLGHKSTVLLVNIGGGPLMTAANDKKNVMSLDNAGNMVLAGALSQNGVPTSVLSASTGGSLSTYSTQGSAATVEDVGEGQLVAGRADIRLDPKFASVIDGRAPYLVFLTAQGKTPRLYVERKTAIDFVVREYGATSAVAFDYRVVAKPFASNGGRPPQASLTGSAAQAFDANAIRHRTMQPSERVERLLR